MKRRISLRRYTIHILAIPGLTADVVEEPYSKNAVIACTSKRTTAFLESQMIEHKLILEFPDVEDSRCLGAFNRAHARAIVNFLNGLPKGVTELYVCCSKGGSRSAGLAAAILRGSGRKDTDVWKNPFYVPNTLVYKRMCNEIGILMPWITVWLKKRSNERAYRKAQKRGNSGKYERWQILP